VKEFVGSCDVYALMKNPYHHPHGFFQPLPILFAPWPLISVNFIIDLPLSDSFDSILVVVDCFKKIIHFIPCNKSITNKRTTKLFFDHVF
jgi:hypothetical protein